MLSVGEVVKWLFFDMPCYSDDAIIGSTYTLQHNSSIAYDFNMNLHSICAVYVLIIMLNFLIIFSNCHACEQ